MAQLRSRVEQECVSSASPRSEQCQARVPRCIERESLDSTAPLGGL